MQTNNFNNALNISKRIIDEMVNTTGVYDKLHMTIEEANDRVNIEAFIAAERREPRSPNELIEKYEFQLDNYYKLPDGAALNLDNVKKTARFIRDKQCGLDVPTLGELHWHFTGEATPIWTVDLNPRHHTQYRYRKHCHDLVEVNEAVNKMAQSAAALATSVYFLN